MINTNQTQNETGTQLFARLVNSERKSNSLPSTDTLKNEAESSKSFTQIDKRLIQLENDLMLNKTINLDANLFSKEISNKDIIEIFGKTNTGKTELIMHLIARLLMPAKFKVAQLVVDLGEYSCFDKSEIYEPSQMPKVIFINTDAKFCILRLFTIMENRLKKAISKHSNNLPNDVHKLLQKFIRDCLKNLVFYQCFTNEHLIYSLVACEHYIQNLISSQQNHNGLKSILPIFIDTINSNFEIIDRFNSQIGQTDVDHTEKYCIQLVKRLIENYNICLIASRIDLTNNNHLTNGLKNLSFAEYSNNSYKKWQSLVTKRIEMVGKIEEITDKNEESFLRTYFKTIELIKKSNNEKPETNLLKDFTRFDIGNTGFDFNR